MQNQMSWGEIFRTYTLLTIGEGLVIILPSFLVAVSSAVIITRAASRSNLGADTLKQILAQPKALQIVAVAALVFGLTGLYTELPAMPFLLMAALLGGTANLVKIRQRQSEENEAAASERAEEPAELVAPFLLVPPVELELGYGLLGMVDSQRRGNLLSRIKMIRQNLAVELGIVVPPIRVKDNIKLPQNAYVIRVKSVERASAEIYPGHYLVMNPAGIKENLPGIRVKEPTFNLEAVWVNEGWRDKAEVMGHTVVDAATVLVTNLMEMLRSNAHEILGRQEVHVLIDNLRPNYPAVVDDLVPNLLSLGEVHQILKNLLKERVPIRDLVTILETLSTAARTNKDVDILTEQVRLALGNSICNQLQVAKNSLSVLTLDPGVERLIAESVQSTPHGYSYSLEPGLLQKIYTQIGELTEKILPQTRNLVVLCSPQVRMHVKKLTERMFPQMTVLSYGEIPQNFKVQSMGMIAMPAAG